jgi:UDP-2,4-diacetamido-2,4,6-trideoxy-beta-L-altropyranose hydrolase
MLLEASAAIGGGHLARCLALATVLVDTHDVHLSVNDSAASLIPNGQVTLLPPWPDACPEAGMSALTSGALGKFDIAFIDHYHLEAATERGLRGVATRIAVIDDLADRDHDCDLLIDATPGQTARRYVDRLPTGCTVLAGADYALLRPEFLAARLNASRERKSEGRRVLVSMGATDPAGATSIVLGALQALTRTIAVTVVLSRSARHLAEIEAMLPHLGYPARLVCDPPSMAAIYADHDVAIGAPATSALERCCLGLPSLLIETADNQRDLGAALASSGATRLLGRLGTVAPRDIASALDALIDDTEHLRRLRTAGQRLVDGRGAARVTANLAASFRSRDGSRLVGRRLGIEDAARIFDWQTAEGTRAYSRQPEPPTWPEHCAWIEGRLDRSDALTEVVTEGGEPVAMARLDPVGYDLEASIVVAPTHRGRGIGQAAIRYLDAFARDATVEAWVHSANDASMALFKACNYSTDQRARRRIRPLPH